LVGPYCANPATQRSSGVSPPADIFQHDFSARLLTKYYQIIDKSHHLNHAAKARTA
jgi:hypothetical protein